MRKLLCSISSICHHDITFLQIRIVFCGEPHKEYSNTEGLQKHFYYCYEGRFLLCRNVFFTSGFPFPSHDLSRFYYIQPPLIQPRLAVISIVARMERGNVSFFSKFDDVTNQKQNLTFLSIECRSVEIISRPFSKFVLYLRA